MCIRDRVNDPPQLSGLPAAALQYVEDATLRLMPGVVVADICLLYTSDAADERSSVDLGGRRIIKKKNRHEHRMSRNM